MSIPVKMKPCKGTGKAKDFVGCGHDTMVRTYGLCQSCYATWLYTTDEGKAKLERTMIKAVPKRLDMKNKPKNKLVAFPEVYERENRAELQIVINTIVKLLDKSCKCIDCERTQSTQWDAGHYKSRGAHPALAFNLHNIFRQSGYCNFHSEGNKGAYETGLADMYGDHYAEYVKNLHQAYDKSGLTAAQLPGARKIANQIKRELQKADQVYDAASRIKLREEYNQRIGIYLKKPYIAPQQNQENEQKRD